MSTRRKSKSPRRSSKEFIVNVQEFETILKNLVKQFRAILIFQSLLLQYKDATLTFKTTGKVLKITSSDVKELSNKFAKEILLLKNYFRAAKKKPRGEIVPEKFLGIYEPVVCGEALKNFFSEEPERFGFVDPKTKKEQLMKNLELVASGYMLRNTITMLFHIYIRNNPDVQTENGQFVSFDDYMNKYFGPESEFSAVYYVNEDKTKTLMNVALLPESEGGLGLQEELNTYQVLSRVYGDSFNTKSLKTFFFQNIAAINYYSKKEISNIVRNYNTNKLLESSYKKDEYDVFVQAYEDITNPDILNQMLEEHNLVKQASLNWNEIIKENKKKKKKSKKKETNGESESQEVEEEPEK